MKTLTIRPSQLQGHIKIPPSKSHTLRAIFLASLAVGKSTIAHYLESPDTHAMIEACRSFGATLFIHPERLIIDGVAGRPRFKENTVIDAGNSGLVLRFITAIAALSPIPVTITGDHSLQTRRPLKPLLQALEQLGATCHTLNSPDHAPVSVCGPIQAGIVCLQGQDSQPVSALLFLSALANQTMTIQVNNPGELPWVALTVDWLQRMNVSVQHQEYQHFTVKPDQRFKSFDYTVPGDFSSVLFPVVAALITHSEITLSGLNFADLQGDQDVLDLLEKMGAQFNYNKTEGTLWVTSHQGLIGLEVDLNHCVDALPILAVLACYATTPSHFYGVAIARLKESDRIEVMRHNLTIMGAEISETEDGLKIQPSVLKGAWVESHQDHRIAMALAVAALGAEGNTQIHNCDCIAKTYASFSEDFKHLGALIEVSHE